LSQPTVYEQWDITKIPFLHVSIRKLFFSYPGADPELVQEWEVIKGRAIEGRG
jgi:hypothetical protein